MAKKSQKRVGWLRHFKVGDKVLYHGNKAMARVSGEVVAVRDYRGAVVQWSPSRRGSVMVRDMVHQLSHDCQIRVCRLAHGLEPISKAPNVAMVEGQETNDLEEAPQV